LFIGLDASVEFYDGWHISTAACFGMVVQGNCLADCFSNRDDYYYYYCYNNDIGFV